MVPFNPRRIHVRSGDSNDPWKLSVTDEDGNPIDGVKSITWRARGWNVPTAVLEVELLDLDVVAEERPSNEQVKLDEIRQWLDSHIETERGHSAHYHEVVRHPPDFVARVYETMRAEFFGDPR